MSDLKPVFIVSAPSGTGKTTLNRMLVKQHPEIEVAVSLTCRPMREGEVNGRDYEFVSEAEFKRNIEEGNMLEWATVHGYLYGTSKKQLMEIQQRDHYSLLEIDVQGWKTAKEKLKAATAIFILPPSLKELWVRLEQRGTDSLKTRWKRLVNAKKEIEAADDYDFFIINDDVQKAYKELESIIIKGEKGKINRELGISYCQKLLEEFECDSWFQALKKKIT